MLSQQPGLTSGVSEDAAKTQLWIIRAGRQRTTTSNLQPHPNTLRSTPIARAMFLQRSAFAAARRAAPRAIARRTFTTTFVRRMLL